MTNRPPLTIVPDQFRGINGAISLVPKREVSPDELEQAEKELRIRTKSLVKQVETTYWDLAQCLWEVFDGVPGGYRALLSGDGAMATRRSLFEKWDYASFEEYCEKEVGIKKRTGQNLRYAYYWFEISLTLPRELKEQIRDLGRSKVYILSGFVNQDNVMSWVEKAKEMTTGELKKAVRAANAALKAGASSNDPEEGDQDDYAASDEKESDEKVPPAPDEMHTLHFSLYKPQFETWTSAFEQASKMSKSDKQGHNLEMICQDFLSNNDFSKEGEETVSLYLAKMERRLGVKLIAVDHSTGAPVYGAALLWMLVKARAEAADDDESESEQTDEPEDVIEVSSSIIDVGAVEPEEAEELIAKVKDEYEEDEIFEDDSESQVNFLKPEVEPDEDGEVDGNF